jgi:hypothetical protein
MSKWEYLSITARNANDDWRPQFREGVELSNWEKGPKLHDYLNQLGNDGWELVSETFDQQVSKWLYGSVYIDSGFKNWEAKMAAWSADGWELASASGWHDAGGYVNHFALFFQKPVYGSVRRFIFKRPKA